jgi:hypothetical protein
MEEKETKGNLFKKGLKVFSRFGKNDAVDLPTAEKGGHRVSKEPKNSLESNGLYPSDPESIF